MQAIGNVMTTLSVKVMIDKATSDDDQPTAGYLYKDITELTFSSATQSQALQDALIQKLQKDSFNVRLKALRIIKHCLQSGHYSFRRDLQRRTEYLRDCINFRGPPDPFRGDAPYKLVREEAQIILNALFQGEDNKPESSNRPTAMSSASNNSISSGNDNYQSNSIFSSTVNTTPTAPGKKYMQGFGNTPSAPTKPQGGFFENVVNKVSEITTDIGQTLSGGSGGTSHYSGGYGASYNTGSLPGTRDYGNSSFQLSSGSLEHQKGVPGGGWGSDTLSSSSPSFNVTAPDPPSRSAKFVAKNEDESISPASQTSISSSSLSQSDGVIEKKVVEEITGGSGVRVVPPKEVISQFCSRCSSLDCRIVTKLLVSKLNANSAWQTNLKALCALEGLLQGQDHLKYEVELKNDESLGLIRGLHGSVQKAVADRAASVLSTLGMSEQNGVSSQDAERKETSKRKELKNKKASQTPSSTSTPTSKDNLIDLFDGLSVSSSDSAESLLLQTTENKLNKTESQSLVDIFSSTDQKVETKKSSTLEIDFLSDLSTPSTSVPKKNTPSLFGSSSPSTIPYHPANPSLLPQAQRPIVHYPPGVAPLVAVRPAYVSLSTNPVSSENSSMSSAASSSSSSSSSGSAVKVTSGFDFVQDELKKLKS